MANIKSAKKRILVNRKKALRNKMVKSGVKTAVRKLNDQVAAGDQAAAQAALLPSAKLPAKVLFIRRPLPARYLA